METTEDYCARIGSRDALEGRQKARLSGNLNRTIPIRRKGMGGRQAHPLACQCEECIPDEVREWLKTRSVVTKGMYSAIPPKPNKVKVITKKVNPPRKRESKWQSRGRSGN